VNYNDDENLKKFDESKKNIINSQITKSTKSECFIEKKNYPDFPVFEKKYELVEEIFKDGSFYKGEKFNQKRHGKGKFVYSDGGIFEGDWKFGKMDGYGVLYYGDQSIAYEGEWKRDKFQGRGILHNEKNSIEYDEKFYDLKNLDNINNFWTKYEGNFAEDHKEGSGILYFPNGDKISGNFLKDKLSGKNCVLYRKNGEVLKGEWTNNILVKLKN